jgi:hypothetical protein
VGDVDGRGAGGAEDGGEVDREPLAQRPVQRGQRLVEEQDARLGGQCAGERDALGLPERVVTGRVAMPARPTSSSSSAIRARCCTRSGRRPLGRDLSP